jgi:hypothetical protein
MSKVAIFNIDGVIECYLAVNALKIKCLIVLPLYGATCPRQLLVALLRIKQKMWGNLSIEFGKPE